MNHLKDFQNAIRHEAQELLAMADKVEAGQIQKIAKIFQSLTKNKSTLVITGIGKSALIGKKISSTFASLGLRSIFLHPTEALHGDLGLTNHLDAAILISKSGSTQELLELTNYLPMPKENIIGMFGNTSSPLALSCGVVLDCSVSKEVCVNNLAPTTSTTATLAMGDALAVLFQKVTKMTQKDFAINHPAGYLGKSLLLKIEKIMVPLDACPTLTPDSTFQEAIVAMTKKPVGACIILEKKKLKGILVEGDIRRALLNKKFNPNEKISKLMNKNPISVEPDQLVSEAARVMHNQGKQISIVPVCKKDIFVGVLRVHDILKEGFKI